MESRESKQTRDLMSERQYSITRMNERIKAIMAEDENLVREGKVRWAPGFPDTFSSDEIRRAVEGQTLLYLYLEFVTVCNFGCKGCWAGYETDMRDFDPNERHTSFSPRGPRLEPADYFKLIDQAKALGVKYINFIGGGEPTISPLFFPLVEYANAQNIRFETFTNGSTLDREMAHRMLDLRVAPFLKVFSLDPDKNDYMVSRRGAFAQTMRAVDNLLEAGYGTIEDPPAAIETVISEANWTEIPDLWRFARDRGLIPFFERFVGEAYDGQPGRLPSPQDLLDLYLEIRAIDRDEYGFTFPLVPLRIGFGCDPVLYGAYISVDGNVQICAGSPTVLGNVGKLSLAEIIRSSAVLDRVRHLEADPNSYCGQCAYRARHKCYGCPGQAEIMGGSAHSDDPLCFHIPENMVRKHGGVESSSP